MDKTLGKILIIDDDEDVLLAAKMLLRRHSQEVTIEKNPKKIPFLISNYDFDVILLDMNFSQDTTSGKEGFFWLEQILERKPEAVVVLITAFGDVEMAVKALKVGATDFVLKPWDNAKLIETLENAQAVRNEKAKDSPNDKGKPRRIRKKKGNSLEDGFGEIIGESQVMKDIFAIIGKVAETDANILILGENGTGKELIARAIHRHSRRKEKVFVSVDMGAITETLFESELFGHKKGSFTDAKEDRAGRFESAHTGTLFLDEIGNLSMPLQSKLLTALQRREVIRVGSNKPVSVDIRLVAATNMPVYEMVQSHEFRQDLLYRINTVEIHLPPLRKRTDDIPLLANHFVKECSGKYNKPDRSSGPQTMTKLQKYHWPGNIRELEHAIERAVIMSDNEMLRPEDFRFLLYQESEESEGFDSFNLDEVEKQVIKKAIAKNSGNISKAARELGLTRASLYRRLEKHGL